MSTRQRVAFLITNLAGGGAERATAALAEGLDKNLFEVCLILERDTLAIYEPPDNVEIVRLSAANTRGAIIPLIRFLRKWRPDVIYSALPHLNVISVVASKFVTHPIRTVVSVHNNQKRELAAVPDGWLLKRLMPMVYKLCSAAVVVSHGIRDELVRSGVKPSKLHVIYNPIDIEHIKQLSKESVHHKWLNSEYSVVMSMGRLVPQKNFKLLLQSFSNVYNENPNARLIVVGGGEMMDELLGVSKDLGLEAVVDFVGLKTNPFSWLVNASCFVLTSEYEGFGMVIVEAMSVGVPVVSVDCKYGPGEILKGGEKGVLVKDGTAESISASILEVLNNRELAESFREKGKERANDFNVDVPVRQLEKLFYGLLSNAV